MASAKPSSNFAPLSLLFATALVPTGTNNEYLIVPKGAVRNERTTASFRTTPKSTRPSAKRLTISPVGRLRNFSRALGNAFSTASSFGIKSHLMTLSPAPITITTGFDCREVLHLVMCRKIFSPILYQQMRGRGTRTAPHIGKQQFVIYDSCLSANPSWSKRR